MITVGRMAAIGCATLCILSIAGCSGSSAPDLTASTPASAQSEKFIDALSKDTARLKVLNSTQAPSRGVAPAPAKGAPAELTSYVQGLVDKTTAQSPWPTRRISAIVLDCPVFTDELQEDGILRFCLDTFRHLGSESEIAFIVAHEVSHVVLRHTEGDAARAAEQQKEIETTFFFLGPNGRTAAETKIANINASMKRSQEREADLLGVDLMTKAGFNPNGAYTFFDLKRRSRLAKGSYRDTNEAAQKNRLDRSIKSMDDITDLGEVAAKAITNAADNAIMTELRDDDHISAAGRMEVVARYIGAHYQSDTSRPLGATPWKAKPAKFSQTSRLFASARDDAK